MRLCGRQNVALRLLPRKQASVSWLTRSEMKIDQVCLQPQVGQYWAWKKPALALLQVSVPGDNLHVFQAWLPQGITPVHIAWPNEDFQFLWFEGFVPKTCTCLNNYKLYPGDVLLDLETQEVCFVGPAPDAPDGIQLLADHQVNTNHYLKRIQYGYIAPEVPVAPTAYDRLLTDEPV